MRNILKYNKENDMAHRYIKTNYIDIRKKNDTKCTNFKYETSYNITTKIPYKIIEK